MDRAQLASRITTLTNGAVQMDERNLKWVLDVLLLVFALVLLFFGEYFLAMMACLYAVHEYVSTHFGLGQATFCGSRSMSSAGNFKRALEEEQQKFASFASAMDEAVQNWLQLLAKDRAGDQVKRVMTEFLHRDDRLSVGAAKHSTQTQQAAKAARPPAVLPSPAPPDTHFTSPPHIRLEPSSVLLGTEVRVVGAPAHATFRWFRRCIYEGTVAQIEGAFSQSHFCTIDDLKKVLTCEVQPHDARDGTAPLTVSTPSPVECDSALKEQFGDLAERNTKCTFVVNIEKCSQPYDLILGKSRIRLKQGGHTRVRERWTHAVAVTPSPASPSCLSLRLTKYPHLHLDVGTPELAASLAFLVRTMVVWREKYSRRKSRERQRSRNSDDGSSVQSSVSSASSSLSVGSLQGAKAPSTRSESAYGRESSRTSNHSTSSTASSNNASKPSRLHNTAGQSDAAAAASAARPKNATHSKSDSSGLPASASTPRHRLIPGTGGGGGASRIAALSRKTLTGGRKP